MANRIISTLFSGTNGGGSRTFIVDSEAEMLALGSQGATVGDIAIRTDVSKTFILKMFPPSVLANWQELAVPVDKVLSVFGREGVVVAQNGDYNTSQVTENTNLYFTNARVLTAVEKVNNATGYTLAGGTTSKTLTLTEDSTIDQNLSTISPVSHARINASSPAGAVIGGAWISGNYGDNGTGDRFVFGTLYGLATMGGHGFDLLSWRDMYFQADGPGKVSVGLKTSPADGSQRAQATFHSAGSTILGFAPSAVADASIYNSQVNCWYNEPTNQLTFKAKNSAGAVTSFVIDAGGTADSKWVLNASTLEPKNDISTNSIRVYNLSRSENLLVTRTDSSTTYSNGLSTRPHVFSESLEVGGTLLNKNSHTISNTAGTESFKIEKDEGFTAITEDSGFVAFDVLRVTFVNSLTQLPIAPAGVSDTDGGYALFSNENDSGKPYIKDSAGNFFSLLDGVADSKWQQSANVLSPKSNLNINALQLQDVTKTKNLTIEYTGSRTNFNSSDLSNVFRFFQGIQTDTFLKINAANQLTESSGISLRSTDDLYRFGYDDRGTAGVTTWIRANLGAANANNAFALTFGNVLASAPTLFKFDGESRLTINNTAENESFTIRKLTGSTVFTDSSGNITLAGDLTLNDDILTNVNIRNTAPALALTDSADLTKRVTLEYSQANSCSVLSTTATAFAPAPLKLPAGNVFAVGYAAGDALPFFGALAVGQYLKGTDNSYSIHETTSTASTVITTLYKSGRYSALGGNDSNTMFEFGLIQDTLANNSDGFFWGRTGRRTSDMRINRLGNISIGTNAAQPELLHVAGTFRATGNSSIGGTFTATGATTLSSTLGVSGHTTLTTSTLISYAQLTNIDQPANPPVGSSRLYCAGEEIKAVNAGGQVANLTDLNRRTITASGPINANDDIIFVDSSAGVVEVTVNPNVIKRDLLIVRVVGANAVNILPELGSTINGNAASVALPNLWSSVDLRKFTDTSAHGVFIN